ncbi:helix-turn-helix domain-containing protein [Neorhizobium sp. JUb45]|uniref:LexA family transcriptional regulator n=1 Tax=Neorhizobium sp. JUb45 TaxID=2485113 RepID=UPI0010DF8C89|nr:helix-turn-helix domain-containing protein [Neorhizobium sp. JUb45]TCR07217.1 phage repressor protein C with HTH and peptisase S24 domain [Neorhizobium sp. JUb45]
MSQLSDLLVARAKELNISQVEIADRLEMTPQAISEIFRGNTSSPRKWRELAALLGIAEDEMRQLMKEASGESAAGKFFAVPSRVPTNGTSTGAGAPDARIMGHIPTNRLEMMLPVLGEAVGGEGGEYSFNGHVLDYVACPPSLQNVPNAYAVYIDGESMWPRYKAGETVYVHPTKPSRRGDDVIVQIRPASEDLPPLGYVKEFVGWAGSDLVLRQYNPEGEIRFAREDVVSVHPIVLSGKY